MRKTWAVSLTAVVAAATVGVVSPGQAQAAWPAECLHSSDQITIRSVSIDLQTFEVRINPAYVDDDVNYIVRATTALALCLENGYVFGPVNCALAKLNEIVRSIDPLRLQLRYVYQDPYTGEIVIDGGRLLEDAGACIGQVNLG